MDQISADGLLIQRGRREHTLPEPHSPNWGPLSSLIDTWVYLSILARFTCLGDSSSPDFGDIATWSLPTSDLIGCGLLDGPERGNAEDLDLAQTAEPYRWAALLPLQQAVLDVLWAHSLPGTGQ
ncbi:hypothetical protein BJX64DRAFT_284008 [Aspergillus heterothallicus]